VRRQAIGPARVNGVPSHCVSCWLCHQRAVLSAASWSDDVPVLTIGPRMICTRCGIIGAGARPNFCARLS
jgi:hypothetical protein